MRAKIQDTFFGLVSNLLAEEAIDSLRDGKVLQHAGTEECRKLFVSLQAAMEQTFLLMVLSGSIRPDAIMHVTHTPTLPTPLCTTDENIGVDSNIVNDTERYKTVAERREIINKLLANGAWMAAVYVNNRQPKNHQYFAELQRRHHTLRDFRLEDADAINDDTSGATAWINTEEGMFFFTIAAFQATAEVKQQKPWQFCCGHADEQTDAAQFFSQRIEFLQKHGVIKKDESFSHISNHFKIQ